MIRQSQKPRHRNTATVLAHSLFILALFVLPELVMAIALPHRSLGWTFYPGFYVKASLYLLVFYLNYFWLVDSNLSLQKPKIVRFVLINIGLVAATLAVGYLISYYMFEPPRLGRHWDRLTTVQRLARISSFILRDAVMLVLAIGIATAMRLSTRYADMQLQKQKLLAAQRTIELENLKSQLNPHFLFNTLNTIYALIDINADNAKEAVHKLSGMLRYMLYEDEPKVPLRREAEFITNYISLMRLRLQVSDHPLEDCIAIPDTDDSTVPPLIFIPLVENALKYGVGGQAGLPVKISIERKGDNIYCNTENSFSPAETAARKGGIGLANLRRRLLLIYGSSSRLSTTMADGIFRASLCLPLQVPAPAPRNATETEKA